MEQIKELKDPDLLTKEEIERLLPVLDDLQDWAAKVQAYALEQALAGVKYEGYKVVEGRTYRQVTDEEGLVKAFEQKGYDASLCYERKLLSVSRLEAITGKKLFAEISAPYVDKPQGKPTLVPESDKRDPITIAADDFNDGFNI